MAWLKYFFIFGILESAFAFLELPPTPAHKTVLDQKLFENVLDPELCEKQMAYMRNSNTMLLARFLDAGYRTPRGILDLNFRDMGNYYQCLGINHKTEESTIEGKYCSISVPLSSSPANPPEFLSLNLSDVNITIPEWFEKFPEQINSESIEKFLKIYNLKKHFSNIDRSSGDNPMLQMMNFQVAICMPKSCTTGQFFEHLFPLSLGLQYEEMYCRLPNDKQWVAADYVAIVIFSLLGLLVGLGTAYEVYSIFVLKKDPKSLNTLCLSFSAFTNSRRLITYIPVPGTIECLDGIRSLAMLWVIVGHTFLNQITFPIINMLDVVDWMQSFNSIWIMVAPITVDTFFFLSGLLVVYTTAGKLTPMKLLKNLHLFYLNRLLRMFPLLAAFILIQASFLSKTADGPHLDTVIRNTENCRTIWWATLLHIQNWLYPISMCLDHTWYLAIDVQLYIVSPIVLFWVLGKRKTTAWIALVCALLAILTASTVFNFLMDLPSWNAQMKQTTEDIDRYQRYFYKNTLVRASPFFVGMIYGYLLHVNRGKKIVMSKISVCIFWVLTFAVFGSITYIVHLITLADWDNQTVDNLLNSFKRPIWAAAVGWMVFACQHGYAGPINWFLSLQFWKVPSRLSYALYIVHYTLMFLVDATALSPAFFSVGGWIFKCFADLGLALIVSYILTLLVDAPFSTIVKQFLGGRKRPQTKVIEEEKQDSEVGKGVVNGGFEAESSKIRL